MDQTAQILRARLAQRAGVNPLINNVLNGVKAIAGQGPGPDPLEQNLKDSVLLNQMQTSTPEFELQKAQTLANLGVQKDLMTKRLEAEQEQQMLQNAQSKEGQQPSFTPSNVPSSPSSGPSPAFLNGTPMPSPGSQVPTLVKGIGQQPTSPTEGDYEAIPRPGIRKYNVQTHSFIDEPQAPEVKPTIRREAAGKAASEMATEQVKANKQFAEATGLAQNYIGAIKAADLEAPMGGGPIGGHIAKIGAKMNMGFPATAALEQPQTDLPTKMTQILTGGARGGEAIQGQLRSSLPDVTNPQGNQAAKFQSMLTSMYAIVKATNDLTPEQRATLSPQDLNNRLSKITLTPEDKLSIDKKVQDLIANTPATVYPKNMNLNLNKKRGNQIPSNALFSKSTGKHYDPNTGAQLD